MIRHILLLSPRTDTTVEEISACKSAVSSLVGKIPGLLDCHWGVNLASPERQDGFTHGFSMDFTDFDALRMYGPHPLHQPVAGQVVATFKKILALDIEIAPMQNP